ncbi:hypothetical protein IW262DRAFT_1461820 [Armillaria fumosa]|nr:hypothetical protein IW262DRAFT_1461820 [Armillaria fumosa]
MSTFAVAIPSISYVKPEEIVGQIPFYIKFILNFASPSLRSGVKSLDVNSVYFTLETANRQPVCVLAGNTFAIRSSMPPTSTGIVPPAAEKSNIEEPAR